MKNLEGVEILRKGVIRGREYKDTDLQEIADNTNRLIKEGYINPPAKLGHDEGQAFALASGLPAVGWFENFRVDGSRLVADLVHAPAIIYEAMKKKLYRKVSAEIYFDFPHPKTQAIMGKVMRAVALLGADVPEVKGLKDLLAEAKPLTLAEGKHELGEEITITIRREEDPKPSEGPNFEDPDGDHWLATRTTAEALASGMVRDGLIPHDSASTSPLESLINWAGNVGYDACVTTPAVRQISEDPETLSGWLKAKARAKGVLGKEHMQDKEDEMTIQELQEQLTASTTALAEKDKELVAAKKKADDAAVLLAETQKAEQERAKVARKAAVAVFIEANKEFIVPAIAPMFEALCEGTEAVIKLAEGKEEKLTGHALVMRFADEFIKAKVARFEELARGTGSETKSDPKEVKGADLNQELHMRAVELSEQKKIPYWDAIREVAKAEPSLVGKA